MEPAIKLPARPREGHKGTFGTVCVIGGQAAAGRVMIGGPALAALGALRAGAGLAVLAMPEPLLAAGLTIAPSATGLALPVDAAGRLVPSGVAELLDRHRSSFSCIAIGPGLGAEPPQQQVVVRLLAHDEVPVVVDADACNALAQVRDFPRDLRAPSILTPHPGEYARLAQALGLKIDVRDQAQRVQAAEAMAQRLGCVVVLKGAGTVITDGVTTRVNSTGNVALATAGTGDVLSGIIAGLVSQAQGELSLLECAAAGVWLHGLAADRWAACHGTAGLLAGDLLAELPRALQEARQG
jgi:NAD(P)H-hydrate epimerase